MDACVIDPLFRSWVCLRGTPGCQVAHLVGSALMENRRAQQIGRREVDLWCEAQIAKGEVLLERLDALLVAMCEAPRGHLAGTYWADRLMAILEAHRGPR